MGNIIDSVPCTLTPADMERLAGVTVFNPVEIRAIWYYYHYLNNQQEKITKRYQLKGDINFLIV